MGLRAVVLGAVATALGVWAAPAWASFPGRDGDLVVASGGRLTLVSPATGSATAICTTVALCGDPARPSFSPNGQAIVFMDQASHRPVVVASDGSCLWCLVGTPLTTVTGRESAFVAGGRAVTVAGNRLWHISLTAGGTRRLVRGVVADAVWSSRGLAAVVRRGWVWVGRPGDGKLRRLARGGSPSFSPGGAQLAFARGGRVWIVRVRGRRVRRRLVDGRAPAWSPNGRQLAYIGRGGAVETIAVHGGRPHPVGAVHGSAVDWQPLPATHRQPCKPPRGSAVLASSGEAIVYSLGENTFYGPNIYGCLKALNVTRPLSNDNAYFAALIAVRVAGRFVALEPEYSKGGAIDDATLYDLSDGSATQLAEVGDLYGGGPSTPGIDSLALDSSGFAAWRETTTPLPSPLDAVSCPSASVCVAGNEAGNILNSTNPTGGSNAWGLADVPNPQPDLAIAGVSCPSISLCAAVNANDVLTSTDPGNDASTWTNAPIGGYPDLSVISCPSVSLCVAGGGGPTVLTITTSTDPTGGASSWTTASVPFDGGDLDGVSCPSVTLCVATTDRGDVFTSTDPTGGASAWARTSIDQGSFLRAVSCPSVALCVAVDQQNHILTSTDPTGGANAWTSATFDPDCALHTTSCISEQLYVRDDQGTRIVDSALPGDGNSIGSVTFGADSLSLSWTNDGLQQQLHLH